MYDFSEYLERALNKALAANNFLVSWFLLCFAAWFAKRNVWRWVETADEGYFLLDAIESILLIMMIVLMANCLKKLTGNISFHFIELVTVFYLGIYSIEVMDSTYFDRCSTGVMEYSILSVCAVFGLLKLILLYGRWKTNRT